MSFLATVAKDFKSVFAWLGSSKGQAVVTGAENLAETAGTIAGAGGLVQMGINLANKWMAEAIKVESLAAAAGQQEGSSVQKATAVISTMTPELTNYLQAQGITSANVTSQANAINTAVVNLLNTITSVNTPGIGTRPVNPTPGAPQPVGEPAPTTTGVNQ